MKPSKANIRKWCNALRSGEYKQTTGRLQDDKGFCCLGVACKVFIPEEMQWLDDKGHLIGGRPLSQRAAPEWLEELRGDFLLRTGFGLAELNDVHRFTFDEIADLLEAVYIHEVLS